MRSTTRRQITENRDAALLGLLLAVIGTLAAVMSLLVLGAAATTVLVQHRGYLPAGHTWLRYAVAILRDPAHPGTATHDPQYRALDDHSGLYWVCTSFFAALTITAVAAVARWWYSAYAPTPPGHATRRDIRATLTAGAIRPSAHWTRPGLTEAALRHARTTDYAVPLHRGPNDEILVTSLENPTGTIATTRSGKSRRDVIHKLLAAPGALIASTTKPDLVEFAALARARRPGAGPVLVCDATGTVRWPAPLRFSPITGCHTATTALRRAKTMVDTASLDLADVGGNDRVFQQRAATVLCAYLLAAAHSGSNILDLARWATSRPLDHTPAEILRAHGYADLADNLAAEMSMVAETTDAVWLCVRRVVEPFFDPGLRELCTPTGGRPFDPAGFLHACGTLFIIGDELNPIARPVLTALAEDLLHTQRELALHEPTRRLDPPVTTVVDELLLGTPIPKLPHILADSAGRGALIHWWAQSRAQLDELYGERGTRALLDNTLTLTVHSGLSDDRTLQWLSTLSGHHERLRHQTNTDGMLTPGRTGISTETVPTLRPADIRTLRHDQVLILHRHLRPILGRLTDIRDRLDWPQLSRDIDTIRAGTAPITRDGYLITRRPVHPAIDTSPAPE